MKFSVKKRINRILENVQRVQELAGLSDPEAGYTAPAEAYEDDYQGLKKRFGNQIINKLVLFLRTSLNTPVTMINITDQDINLKILNTQDVNLSQLNNGDCFLRFGGYMNDTRNYNFSLGYKSKMGETIFLYKFTMDLNGNMSNWQSLNL